jgi:hypothetical protein
MKCSSCGHENRDAAKCCEQCAARSGASMPAATRLQERGRQFLGPPARRAFRSRARGHLGVRPCRVGGEGASPSEPGRRAPSGELVYAGSDKITSGISRSVLA